MKTGVRSTILLLLLAAALSASSSQAQGDSTAARPLQLSAFGGVTGTFLGLLGGHNIGVTAGADLGLREYWGLLPSVEVRGTYPVYAGKIAELENVLGGLKVERGFGSFHPYGDLLFGRGEIDYYGKGLVNPSGTFVYQSTNSNILSFGGGVDCDLTPSLAFKAELLLQNYKVPVTTSGEIWAKATTFGVVYRFGYGQHHPD